jgi:hypothetical protein
MTHTRILHGKEGVDGSSPSEGLSRSPAKKAGFLSSKPATHATPGTRGASVSGDAHSLQNFALSGFSVPQEGQTATGGV